MMLTVTAGALFFVASARAETRSYQTTGEIAAAHGEWWDSTGTVLSVVLSNVGAEKSHSAGDKGNAIHGQVFFLQHDFVTGDDYFGFGPPENAPTFGGRLSSASYEATIPLSRFDRTIGDYVDAGTVTIRVDLQGYGPTVKSKNRTTDKEASVFNIHEDFAGATRNAVPTFAIDGVEVDEALFDFTAGSISLGSAKYKYTVNP